MSAQCKVFPRDSSLSFGSSRHLGLSIKHDSWDNALIDNRATKQFAFCHSWFALCTVINYLQCWSCYMQHHNSIPPSPRANGDAVSRLAGRINCCVQLRSQCEVTLFWQTLALYLLQHCVFTWPSHIRTRIERNVSQAAATLLQMFLAINHLTPNGHYMGRTAQLTSRCCILYIYSTNICTEYFKHAA